MPHISAAYNHCGINQAATFPLSDTLCRKEIFRKIIVKQGVLGGSYIEGKDIFAKTVNKGVTKCLAYSNISGGAK